MRQCYWCAYPTKSGMHSKCWKALVCFATGPRSAPDLNDLSPFYKLTSYMNSAGSKVSNGLVLPSVMSDNAASLEPYAEIQ